MQFAGIVNVVQKFIEVLQFVQRHRAVGRLVQVTGINGRPVKSHKPSESPVSKTSSLFSTSSPQISMPTIDNGIRSPPSITLDN
ncbi:MAG: hypothetical protein ACJARK_002754 [Marinobacter psychrophilus]